MEPKTAGQRLSEGLSETNDPFALTILIVEAARIADRLEKLDALLSGDRAVWARLRETREGDIVVTVDSALSEARQQATVLKHLLAEIHRQRAQAPRESTDDDLAGM